MAEVTYVKFLILTRRIINCYYMFHDIFHFGKHIKVKELAIKSVEIHCSLLFN